MIIRRTFIVAAALVAALHATSAFAANIKIGASGPLTGSYAGYGLQLEAGVKLAVEDINAQGGILGNKLELLLGDDQGDPKQGVSVANHFVAGGAKYVIGHSFSSITMPASDIYAEAGILMVTPAASNPAVTERGLWNVFRTCGRDDQQGAFAGAYLAKAFSGKKLAVVHDKSAYGKGLADETKKAANKAGLTEVMYEGINPGEKDYSALILKMKEAHIDVVYFGGYYTEAGLIIRQMRDQGLNTVMMSGDGLVSNEFWSIAGPGAAGTVMTFHPDPKNRPEAQGLYARMKERNIQPEATMFYAYAAVQVIKQAAEKSNSTDSKKLAEYMHSGAKFDTVIGPISYDKKGDITHIDYDVFVWNSEGKYNSIQ